MTDEVLPHAVQSATGRATPDPRSAYRHLRAISTRWMDNDIYGHVNNVVYYSYFDTAVNLYLLEQGVLDIERRPVLGLDITSSSIKLIELSLSGGQYVVDSYAAEATPQNAMNEKAIVDADAVGEAISRAIRRAGAGTREVAVAIAGDAAITKVIQMPRNLNDSDLEAQVEMQADQYIPFPMDEVAYDFEVLGVSEKDPESQDVLLVASRSENVEQRRAAVNAAGLSARIVDVEAFALEGLDELFARVDADDLPVQPCFLQPHVHEVRIRGFVFDVKEACRRHGSRSARGESGCQHGIL